MDHVDRILEQWKAERPDLDVTPMGLIGRVKRLSSHLQQEMAQTLAVYGLNLSSFDVLATLRRSGKPFRMAPRELLSATMVTSGTMTNRIDRLVELGLVERVQNPEDGRSVMVELSSKGFQLIEEAVSAHVKTQARLTARLSKDDFSTLNRLIQKIMRHDG